MEQYRGFYIDNVNFNSKEDIDKFVEEQAVLAFKKYNKYFSEHPSIEASRLCTLQRNRLRNEFGYSYERIEELELEAIA